MDDSDTHAFMANITDILDGFFLSCRNDAAYTVLSISNGFERLYGHNVKEFMARGADYAALIHPDDLDPVGKSVTEALEAGTRWQIEYRLKTASGDWRHVLETGGGRPTSSPQIERLDCIIIDFAQMNELATRLAAGEAALDAIGAAVRSILTMLETLRMLSFNARIEAAHSGAGPGFTEVAREMGDLASVGDDVAKTIGTELKSLRKVLRR